MSIAQEIQRLQSAKADIKSAIEGKGVTVGDGSISTYAAKISEISTGGDTTEAYARGYTDGHNEGFDCGRYEGYNTGYWDGKNSVPQSDRCLKTATFTNLNIFGKKEVELNFDNMTYFMNLFATNEQNTTVEHITINCPNAITSTQSMFYCTSSTRDLTLKRVTLNFDTSNSTNCQHMFTYCQALETIDGQPLNFSSITMASRTGAFNQCIALVDVRFAEKSIPLSISFANCPNLSAETRQSIIDGLADLNSVEQYIIAGYQNGPDTYAYPDEEVVIPAEEIVKVDDITGFWMDDGAPVYKVTHGSAMLEDYAYKKTVAGTPQTLTLHKDIKLLQSQVDSANAKGWTVAGGTVVSEEEYYA